MASRWSGPPLPSPIHLPLILERIDRASRILGFQGCFAGPLSLPTDPNRNRRFRSRPIVYLLDVWFFEIRLRLIELKRDGKVSKSSFNRRTRSTVADNRQNRIATGFPLFSRPARRIFRRVVQIPRDADSRNPRVSTRSRSIEREKKRKKENWKSVKKGSWSPRRWSKSCASLEKLARSEEDRG